MYRAIPFLVILILFSCNKNSQSAQFSSSNYRITITGKWQSTEFSVPGGAHFTYFQGMVHNQNASLWMPGTLASQGVENVAEVGYVVPINAEIDSVIAQKNAIALISIAPPSTTGISQATIYCNSNFSTVSFVSMVAPSPDWFVGITNLNLYKNNQWITDSLINLYVMDAGTEEGDVFGYNNPPTIPQQPIQLLIPSKAMVLANGNTSLGPIATVRFTKL